MPDERARTPSLILALVLPGLLVLYALAASGLLLLANRFEVDWLATVAFAALFPLLILCVPLRPLLESLHLVEGELFRLPTPLGFVLVMAITVSVVFVVGFGLLCWLRRPR